MVFVAGSDPCFPRLSLALLPPWLGCTSGGETHACPAGCRVWAQRLEATTASSEQELAGARRSWEAAAGEREARAAQELADARQAAQAAVAEVQAAWGAKLGEEEKRWLEVGGWCCWSGLACVMSVIAQLVCSATCMAWPSVVAQCAGRQLGLQGVRQQAWHTSKASVWQASGPVLHPSSAGLTPHPQEKFVLERQWAERLHAAEKGAAEAQAAMRSQIEAHLAAVTQREAEMARREARREAKRSEWGGAGSTQ